MLTEADVRRLAAEIDYYENRCRHYRREARKARVWNAFRKLIDTDLFFIVAGALMAADIGLLLMMARS